MKQLYMKDEKVVEVEQGLLNLFGTICTHFMSNETVTYERRQDIQSKHILSSLLIIQ